MSLLFKTELNQENNIENVLFNQSSNKKNDYLWSEIINGSKDSLNNKNNITQNQKQNFIFNDIPKPKSILDSKFYLIKKIGHGSSAKVYLGLSLESLIDNDTGHLKYYSIKIIDPVKIKLDLFKEEVRSLERIEHDNILKIFAYGFGQKKSCKTNKEKGVYYIVMEYIEHYEILKYITNVEIGENLGFGEDFGRLIFSQLLDGLETMHDLNIFHRDIKPDNIMIGGNDYKLKYVDFGFSTDQIGKLNSFLGTPNYAAPELHLKRPYFGKSEDIFSLGVTLFVLVTGCLPFKLATPNDSYYQYFIKSDYVEFWGKRMVNVSPSFMELFDNMVAFDYSQRPSISEIRQSAWMKEINWDLLPYLKQEFILREEKIKINELSVQKNKEILKQKNNNQNESKVFSLIQTKKQVRNNVSINDNIITNSNSNNINTNIEEKKKERKNKGKGKIKIKYKKKNLNLFLIKLKKFLKKKGYASNRQNYNLLELEVTNGEIDILIKIERYKKGYLKLNYFQINGSQKHFENFKKLILSLRIKIC